MIKSYLKQVCSFEKDIYQRNLKLGKANDEYSKAQKRIEEQRLRLKKVVDDKKTKISELEAERETVASYVPKGISNIIYIFLGVLVATVLLAWGIRAVVFNVFNATDADSAAGAYAVINILPVLLAWLVDWFFNWYTSFRRITIFIVSYMILTSLTFVYFLFFENRGYSISYAMTFFTLVLIVIEIVLGIINCLVAKNDQDIKYLANRKKLSEYESKIIRLKSEKEQATKKLTEYNLNSQKAINLMSQDIKVQKQNLESAKTNLANLYSKNVLHPKYQNWIAAATIYEYFDTGICRELEDYKGAYKFYEEQLIGKQILSSLSAIKSSIDFHGNRISDSQNYIRGQIVECYRTLERYMFNTHGY